MSALRACRFARDDAAEKAASCEGVNREAARLAEVLADAGGEVEPDADLTVLWATSPLVRARPKDTRYKLLGRPYAYHHGTEGRSDVE